MHDNGDIQSKNVLETPLDNFGDSEDGSEHPTEADIFT